MVNTYIFFIMWTLSSWETDVCHAFDFRAVLAAGGDSPVDVWLGISDCSDIML
jgi:hypothetical protein